MTELNKGGQLAEELPEPHSLRDPMCPTFLITSKCLQDNVEIGQPCAHRDFLIEEGFESQVEAAEHLCQEERLRALIQHPGKILWHLTLRRVPYPFRFCTVWQNRDVSKLRLNLRDNIGPSTFLLSSTHLSTSHAIMQCIFIDMHVCLRSTKLIQLIAASFERN